MATVSPTKTDVYTALRAFIQNVVGGSPAVPVVDGLDNRVPMPDGPFVAMTAILSDRIATNVDSYTDGFFDVPPLPGSSSSEQSTRLDIQLDFYGPNSNDWATMVGTLFRDEYACNLLAPVCAPLYADTPRMMPLVTAEAQYLERWMLTASVQYNPVTVTALDFSTTLNVVAKNVDVEFPAL